MKYRFTVTFTHDKFYVDMTGHTRKLSEDDGYMLLAEHAQEACDRVRARIMEELRRKGFEPLFSGSNGENIDVYSYSGEIVERYYNFATHEFII